jgi:hypothetical protein
MRDPLPPTPAPPTMRATYPRSQPPFAAGPRADPPSGGGAVGCPRSRPRPRLEQGGTGCGRACAHAATAGDSEPCLRLWPALQRPNFKIPSGCGCPRAALTPEPTVRAPHATQLPTAGWAADLDRQASHRSHRKDGNSSHRTEEARRQHNDMRASVCCMPCCNVCAHAAIAGDNTSPCLGGASSAGPPSSLVWHFSGRTPSPSHGQPADKRAGVGRPLWESKQGQTTGRVWMLPPRVIRHACTQGSP